MSKQTILVADSDSKNLQILKENLEAANFNILTVNNGLQAWEKISQNPPALVLTEVSLTGLDGLRLLERLQRTKATSSVPLIFLTNKRELQDRVRSLKMGAKDYLVKPLHVKEVIAHIKMVLGRLERRKSTESNSFFKIMGKLEELNLLDLIEDFGVEQKTGILTVHNSNKKMGQIYFKDGCVINAVHEQFRRENAIFQMLPWKSGYFTMVFKDVDIEDEIAVSNLGLLLQGLRRMEQRQKYLNQLPSPHIKLLPTSVFRKILSKKKPAKDLIQFVSLFDGKRNVLDVIDESCYDDLKTLERIVRLYRQGFIKPVEIPQSIDDPEKAVKPASPEIPAGHLFEDNTKPQLDISPIAEVLKFKAPPFEPEEEIVVNAGPNGTDKELIHIQSTEAISPQIPDSDRSIITRPPILPLLPSIRNKPEPEITRQERKNHNGVSIFIGDDMLGDHSLFDTIFDGNFQVRHFTNHGIGEVKHGNVLLSNKLELSIISIPHSGQFNRLLEHFSDKLINYALIVDCKKPETLDYVGYLARTLDEKYAAPFYIFAVNQKDSDITSIDVLRDRMGISAKLPAVSCDVISKKAILGLISKFIIDLPDENQQVTKKEPFEPVQF